MFNTDLAVNVLMQIELGEREKRAGTSGVPLWNQNHWGILNDSTLLPESQGDLIWDEAQGKYVGFGTCGTAMCAAGWACSISKVPMLWEPYDNNQFIAYSVKDGRSVADAAADLFGITRDDAENLGLWNEDEWAPSLFDYDNSLDDLYRIVAAHAGFEEADIRASVNAALAEHDGKTKGVNLT